MTQGFCTYISSFLVISSPAALYGLSHHSLADLLPAFLRMVFRYHAPLQIALQQCKTLSQNFSACLLLPQFFCCSQFLMQLCYYTDFVYVLLLHGIAAFCLLYQEGNSSLKLFFKQAVFSGAQNNYQLYCQNFTPCCYKAKDFPTHATP